MKEELLSPSREEREGMATPTSCGYCKRRLGNEYHFTCLSCKTSYCYIHMSRHGNLGCGRKKAVRTDPTIREVPLQVRTSTRQGSLVLLGVRGSMEASSANV